ncbi:response regulator [Synergistaceae bacterium OttesenSCG-928-I11]|nr:response regulator [Synergistaceae bacterium OttesenSCG-928-I11]
MRHVHGCEGTDRTMREQTVFFEEIKKYIPELLDEIAMAFWKLDVTRGRLFVYGRAYIAAIYGEDVSYLELSWDAYQKKYCHPDDVRGIIAAGERAISSGENYHTRHRVRNARKNEWIWHHVFGHVVQHGGDLFIFGGARDITDAILLESAYKNIRLEERTAKAILDATPLATSLWDEALNMIDCNREALEMFEVAGKRIYLENIGAMMPDLQPDGSPSLSKMRAYVKSAFETGREEFDFVLLTSGGERIPVSVTFVRIYLDDNIRVAGYARDLREIILSAERMREADMRTQAMLDATPLACTFWDQDFKMVDCNLEALRMFGFSEKEEYLERFDEISPDLQPDGSPSGEKALEMLAAAMRTGRVVFEWLHMNADGEPIPTEITLVKVPWRDGHRIAGYARDLRELKSKMAEIERTQNELRDALARAEEGTRAKSDFLSNMSHEIRTPMNAIIGMTDIAKGTDDVEKMRYCLGKIEDASGHLLGVINDILDMSKIEAGKFELSEADFALEKMLLRVTNVINFRVDQKGQSFLIKVDPDVPSTLVGDQQRLAQVITNLLSNAVKFTYDGGKISLLVHLESEREGICTLRFEVVDNGIGISKEQQAKLFQSFAQADGSITRRFGGTGLGLVISKRIVEAMGGNISVESKLNSGSRFVFTVKVKRGSVAETRKLHPDVDWSNVRVLVVDDEPEVREYFEQIAASAGLSCKTLPDGFSACRALEEGDLYDIIFVDWRMPGMNGIELTRRIRQVGGENIVVVMISATEWAQISGRAMEAGVDRFIAKPLLPSIIIDCVNECLGNHAQASQGGKRGRTRRNIFRGRRILLVEDIEINREILVDLLEETGVEIEMAENGLVACELFERAPDRYDAILMDIHMPIMDGYEATRTIREMSVPRAQAIPIIAMTANVFREDVQKCLAVGMNDHVGKPVNIEEVIKKLRVYLRAA